MISGTILGFTGLDVCRLALCGASIGQKPGLTEGLTQTFLNAFVDAGVHLLDSAIGYDKRETFIGRFFNHRREEIVISTKVGYRTPDINPDLKPWSNK